MRGYDYKGHTGTVNPALAVGGRLKMESFGRPQSERLLMRSPEGVTGSSRD
jgi:hypothetical protein